MELYVLNQNYEKIAVIDYAESIIWTKRYCETGDCEIYLPAETDTLAILKKGIYYSARTDRQISCRYRRSRLRRTKKKATI